MTVVVRRGDRTILGKGYGLGDLIARTSVGPDTIYRIGSMTKSFTAAIILQLAAQGSLRLDDPITVHLPGYPTHGKAITLRHLLTHTSGIKGYTELDAFWKRASEPIPREELVRLFAAEPLDFDPGTRWAYSNSGYYLLGLVIEAVTGRPYADAVQDLVTRPLGLDRTGYCPDDMIGADHARPYAVTRGALVAAPPIRMEQPYAGGGLCSSATDLATWMTALARGRLVDAAQWRLMTEPVALCGGGSAPYGFGLAVSDLDGRRQIAHGGLINDFGGNMACFPDDDLVVVVLANVAGLLASHVADEVARVALDVPPPEARPLEPAQAAAYEGLYAVPARNLRLHVRLRAGRLTAAYVDDRDEGPERPLLWQGGDAFVAPGLYTRRRPSGSRADGRSRCTSTRAA